MRRKIHTRVTKTATATIICMMFVSAGPLGCRDEAEAQNTDVASEKNTDVASDEVASDNRSTSQGEDVPQNDSQDETANPVFATEGEQSQDMELATSSKSHAVEATVGRTPQQSYRQWLDQRGLKDGENRKDDGSIFWVQYAEQRIGSVAKNPIDQRGQAFSAAVLQCKRKLAETINATVESGDRSFSAVQVPPQQAPSAKQGQDQPLSISEKAQLLSEKQLDAAIKTYDPGWQGKPADKTEAEKMLVTLEERFSETMANNARLFTSGAMPVVNWEGNNSRGQYVVGVACISSPRSALFAQAILDDRVPLPKGRTGASIVEQTKNLQRESSDFLASVQGIRLWDDENGQHTVVAFVPVDETKSAALDDAKSGTIARSQIAYFVAEMVEGRNQFDRAMTIQDRSDDSTRSFNESEFLSKVKSRSQRIKLPGVSKVYTWRGEHPDFDSRMQVDVYTWKRSGKLAAGKFREQTEAQRERLQKTGLGSGSDGNSGGQPGSATRGGQGSTYKEKY